MSHQQEAEKTGDIGPVQIIPENTMVGKVDVSGDIDEAFNYVVAHHIAEISPEDNKRILRKIDLSLMPVLMITYTLNFMDKQALSYSANFGLRESNHLTSSQYSWSSGSVFYLAYLVAQPIMARLIQKFPIGRFVAVLVIIWGVILMSTAASRSFAALMTIRAFLGSVESVINPAFIVITSQWYTRQEQPSRVGYWFIGNAIGQILGGVIGYGVGHIHANVVGNWIWYFIIFGAITIVFGCFLLFYLPDSPMNARWLSVSDRELAIARVLSNKTGFVNRHFKWDQFWECIWDPKTWFVFTIALLNNVPAGGVASFGNIVIKGFGYSSLNTTLLQMPLGAIQGISILVTGAIASRVPNTRCYIAAATQIPALIGSILLYKLPVSNKGGRLASYYIFQTHSVSIIMTIAMVSANISGFTKKATVSAVFSIGFCAGQVIAPQLFIGKEAPLYTTAFITAFSCFSILTAVHIAFAFYLMWENRRRDKLCAATGIDPLNATEDNTEGLLDHTDFQQKLHFRYVY